MKCIQCQQIIPEERLKAIPNTKRCVKCSEEKSRIGFMVYSHKTAPELILINPEEKEKLRQANRANNRSR